MTPRESLAYLATARQAEMDLDAVRVYLQALVGQPDALVGRACFALAIEPRELYGSTLPTVGDILARCRLLAQQDAEAERRRLERSLPPADEDNPATWVKCQVCQDGGWLIERCRGGDARTCGRSSKGHFEDGIFVGACVVPHSFAVRCGHESAR